MNTLKKNDKVKIIDIDNIWEGKEGIIIDTSNIDDLNEVTVKISFEDDKEIIQIFNIENLQLITDESLEDNILVEDYQFIDKDVAKDISDIIKGYVYTEDIDGNKISSWIFLSKLLNAENIDKELFFKFFFDLKDKDFKLFSIRATNEFSEEKFILAAKDITEEDISNDYGQYLLGKVIIEEIK